MWGPRVSKPLRCDEAMRQDSCSMHSLTLEASSYAEPNHSSGPTCGFVASPEMGPGPLSVPCRRDTHSYCSKTGPAWSSATNAIRGGAAGSHGLGPYLTGPMAPDPLPAWGRVRRRHVSLRKGSSELTAEAADPPIGVRDLLRHPDPPFTVWGSRAATCPGGTGAGSCASPLQGDSPTHRI